MTWTPTYYIHIVNAEIGNYEQYPQFQSSQLESVSVLLSQSVNVNEYSHGKQLNLSYKKNFFMKTLKWECNWRQQDCGCVLEAVLLFGHSSHHIFLTIFTQTHSLQDCFFYGHFSDKF